MLLPPRPVVRLVMTAIQQIRRAVWMVTRPKANGVHAVALSSDGKVVLVRHTYAKGWRLPGGGVHRGEASADAMLRELREEIGLRAWTGMRHVLDFEHRPDFRRGTGALFRIDGVVFESARSLEIDSIAAFDPDMLPPETTGFTREMIEAALS